MPENIQPYNVALIAPHGNLSEIFNRAAGSLPCRLIARAAATPEESLAAARQLVEQEQPEVICCPEDAADLIQTGVDAPVVRVSTTATDLLRALLPFKGKVRQAAFFNNCHPLPEARSVASALDMEIREYFFQNREEAVSRMLEAAARGAQLGVGGSLVAGMRELCGVDGIMLEAGEDAALRALREALAVARIRRAERRRRAGQDSRDAQSAGNFEARRVFSDIVTQNAGMKDLKKLAAGYAQADAPVLIQGESGSGRELFAQAIHRGGKRADAPFVTVNCAAVPPSQLESELFGHEEGAFTGARSRAKAGCFELAHKGTLFLDEVNELPRRLQSRLMRALEEGAVTRAGGARAVPVDVRLICATDKNLRNLTARGLFRRDLFYRCNVLTLFLPPLRERGGDILHLACHFLRNNAHGAPFRNMTKDKLEAEAGDLLLAHNWPGNVRELANTMESLALTSAIFPDRDLREQLVRLRTQEPQGREAEQQPPQAFCVPGSLDGVETLKEVVRRAEYMAIARQLSVCNGDYARVAKRLGISRVSLWRKLRERLRDAEQDETGVAAD